MKEILRMVLRKSAFLALIIVILSVNYVYAGDVRWIKIPLDIADGNLTCIASDGENPDILYISAVSRLYRSLDGGVKWQVVFRCIGEQKGINDIFVGKDSTIYIATENGIYKSFDYGVKWERVFKGNNFEKKCIKSLTMGPDEGHFYVLTFSNLYEISDKGLLWKKIFTGNISDNENNDGKETTEKGATILKKITIDRDNNLYLSTNKGILTSSDGGKSWNKMSDSGLSNSDINSCLVSRINNDKIYAATEGGVFEYDKKTGIWKNLYLGLGATKIKSLSFNSKNENFIFCLTNNTLYKTAEERNYLKTLYSNFNNEPSIREVHRMTISYAEVHPSKIKNWRKLAQFKAVFPRVSFGIDRDKSNELHWDSGANPDTWVIGPDEEKTGWNIACMWDLGDIIYNEHQTSIDVRSKLMTQLREELLNEVTRLYFERRRLQIEFLTSPARVIAKLAEQELRIQELTASIDALTGGEFSKAIETE